MKAQTLISIILIALGAILFLIGSLFRIMHWPDLFKGFYSGPVLTIIGIILMMTRKDQKPEQK